MREIKFRAWVQSKKILCDVLTFDFNEKTAQLPIETEVNAPYWWDVTSWSFKDIKLLQYTGLKDKNGVEIYEGDIVDCKIYNQQDRGEVVYSEMLGGYFLVGLSRSDTELWGCGDKIVIGNIYEHKHLLEGLK